jgi:hypothetical protein
MHAQNKISKKEIQKAIKEIKKDSWCFRDMSLDERNNFEIATAAIEDFSPHFEYAGELLRSDKTFVTKALQLSGSNLEYTSEELKNDRSLGIIALKNSGSALRYLSKTFQSDLELVKIAIADDPWAIQYAHAKFKNDKNIGLDIVKRDGTCIRYLSKKLQSDTEIITTALKQDIDAAEYLKSIIKKNQSLIIPFISKKGDLIQYLDAKLKNNFEIVLKAVKQNGNAIQFASKELKKNDKIVMAAVKRNGEAIQYIDKNLKSDPKIIKTAVNQNFSSLGFVPETIRKNYFSQLKDIKLEIQIWSRGKEVYGIKYSKNKFDKKAFLRQHKNDYFQLSNDSIASEIPLNYHLGVTISLNGIMFQNIFPIDLTQPKQAIEFIDEKTTTSYRKILNANNNHTCVVWIHDYENTSINTWEDVNDFDINKIKVYYETMHDETDNTSYKIISHVEYDGKSPDENEISGQPKTGYDGPYII